jgi:hypothetical protein
VSGDPTVWCDPPEPGTIGAETHCGCWHDYDMACCYCGNDEADEHGRCPGGPE